MPINHPNAKSIWFTLESDSENMLRNVMVLETDLHLNAQHPDHNGEAVKSLVAAAQNYMEKNVGHVTKLRIVSIRSDQG
jgi:hypothetical protein